MRNSNEFKEIQKLIEDYNTLKNTNSQSSEKTTIESQELEENQQEVNESQNVQDDKNEITNPKDFEDVVNQGIKEIEKEIEEEKAEIKNVNEKIQDYYKLSEEERMLNPLGWKKLYDEKDQLIENISKLKVKKDEYEKFLKKF